MFSITDEDSPVIVQLIGNGLVRNLALPPNEERALVVGSTPRAEFQVDGVRVAPVQFHLERHEGAVWLIPAYGIRDLRLNSGPVLGPAQLEEHNVIKFAGVYLEATIRDADEFAASGDSLYDGTLSNRELSTSYSQELPDEAEETQPAMRLLAASKGPEDEWLTTEIPPLSVKHRGDDVGRSATELQSNVGTPTLARAHSTEQPGDRAAGFTPHGTQPIPRHQPIPSATETGGRPERVPSPNLLEPVQDDPPGVDTVRLVPLRNAPRPQFVPPRPAPTKPAGPPRPKARVDGPPHEPTTVSQPPPGRDSVSFTAELLQPHRAATKATDGPGQASPVARLGLLAKTRPLLAVCFVGFGVALTTVVLLARTRLAPTRSASSTARLPPSLVVSLSSLRPETLDASSAQAQAQASAQVPAQVPALAVTDVAKSPVPVRARVSAPVKAGDARKHP